MKPALRQPIAGPDRRLVHGVQETFVQASHP